MEKVLGIVKKVYLPDEKRNGESVLDLYKTKIGFEIEINGKILKYVEKQTSENTKIYRNDKVFVFFDAQKRIPIGIKAVK